MKVERIKELVAKIEALKEQWPAHSVSAAMLLRLDALEDELDLLLREEDGQARQESTL
jgi:hypothetical protein